MKLNIDRNQFVLVDDNRKICFRHRSKSDTVFGLNLTPSQFFNLDDVLRRMNYLSKLTWYPLGRGVWLYKKGSCVKLVDNDRRSFFRFYERGWEEYKSNVHSIIFSFVHNVSHMSHHQSHARDESQSTNCFGRSLSHLRRRKQVLPWSTRDGCHANGKWSKPSNISRWQSTNPRSHLRRRRGRHASRIPREIEEPKEDGELSGYEADNSEFGSEPTVVIEH